MKPSYTNSKKIVTNCFNIFKWGLHFLKQGTFDTPKQPENNKRIFILGNGPSLIKDIKHYIDKLQVEDTIMVNQAITSDLAFQVRPKYYCLMDPLYWGIYPQIQEERERSLELISKLELAFSKVSWGLTIFAPHHIYKKKNQYGITINNPNITIQTFNSIELYTFRRIEKFLYSKGFAIPSGINVLVSSLCCAICMQYQNIYLLGGDSDWHAQLAVDQQTNALYSIEKHYYHSPQKIFVPHKLSFIFQCISQAFQAYDELASLNFSILNLSSNSMIDAFPRDTLENIIQQDAKK